MFRRAFLKIPAIATFLGFPAMNVMAKPARSRKEFAIVARRRGDNNSVDLISSSESRSQLWQRVWNTDFAFAVCQETKIAAMFKNRHHDCDNLLEARREFRTFQNFPVLARWEIMQGHYTIVTFAEFQEQFGRFC